MQSPHGKPTDQWARTILCFDDARKRYANTDILNSNEA